MKLTLSSLAKTWIFDMDGTLVVHNGYKNGGDQILAGVKEFFAKIPQEDYILILTARKAEMKPEIDSFFKEHGLRYNQILFDIPMGERILFNDRKPSGLAMAYAVNPDRDSHWDTEVEIDENL